MELGRLAPDESERCKISSGAKKTGVPKSSLDFETEEKGGLLTKPKDVEKRGGKWVTKCD